MQCVVSKNFIRTFVSVVATPLPPPRPPQSPISSPCEHSGTQMVKPTLVMSGKGGRRVGGLLQMAQRASPISLHKHTHTHKHMRSWRNKGVCVSHTHTHAGGKREQKMDVCMARRCRWVCEPCTPERIVCSVCAMAGVDLVWNTKPWHLCPRHATLRGTARAARGAWQQCVCL